MRRAVILAGGPGKELAHITRGRPKTLLKVVGKPIIERVAEALYRAGFREAVIITDKPREFDDVTVRLGRWMELEVRQHGEGGVRAALIEAAPYLRRGYMLVYGDTLMPPEAYDTVARSYETWGTPVLMVVPEADVTEFGAVRVGRGYVVESFDTAPTKPPPGTYAFGGVAYLSEELAEALAEEGDIGKAVTEYVKGGGTVRTALWSGWWVDIGHPVNLLEAQYYVLREVHDSRISSSAEIAPTAVIEGPVIVEDGAFIDHYAVIKGPAYIGTGATIGAHSLIRRYTGVGAGAVFGAYAEAVWSIIGERATIGKGAFLGHSVVGDGAVVEANVVTRTYVPDPEAAGIRAIAEHRRRRTYYKVGASVGSGCRVRAGEVLDPGTRIEC